MFNSLKTLNPLAVLVVSVIGFVIGGLWFSPLLFVKAWMAEVKMTPEAAKAAGWGKSRMVAAFCLTVVSTFALAVLVALRGETSPLKGAELGLFVGALIVASRQGTNALFELRSRRYYLIVAGYDVTQFTVLGAILAVWR
jgi:hypothetical protein